MHSIVSLAAKGSVSVKPMCEEPNQAFISVVRNDPKACDTSSGIVIISIPPSQRASLPWRRCYPNIGGPDRDREAVLWLGAALGSRADPLLKTVSSPPAPARQGSPCLDDRVPPAPLTSPSSSSSDPSTAAT